MLVLTFRIGEYIYGLKASMITEVVPPAIYKELPRSPEFVKGLFNYRGSVTPVVDLSMLACDIACKSLMSSRIIILDVADLDGESDKGSKFIGLLAENITETVKLKEADFEAPGVVIPEAPWLGRVARIKDCMLQLVEPQRLLTDKLRKVLFPDENVLTKDGK